MEPVPRCPRCQAPLLVEAAGTRCVKCEESGRVRESAPVAPTEADPAMLRRSQVIGGGRFELIQNFGAGGMGEVWLAKDLRLKRQVAVKLLPPQLRADRVAMENLQRETARCQALTHPNITRIHDLHEDDKLTFITMEYVDGCNLSERLRQSPTGVMSWEELKPLVRQLAAALDFAHRQNIIHRDLKPANLMVDSQGNLKLADFGIAATINLGAQRVSDYHPGSGTILYMSPQQMEGLLPQVGDDVYSLGATLYELLTGLPPFHSGDIHYQLKHTPAVPPQQRLAEAQIDNPIPAHVADTILACLSKSIHERPASASEVARRLTGESIAGADVASAPTPASPAPSAGWWRQSLAPLVRLASYRERWLAGSGAALFTVLVGLAILYSPAYHPFERWSYGLSSAALGVQPVDDVVVVAMDDAAHDELNQPRDRAWDRSIHAALIRQLNAKGARQIVFDIVFFGDGPDPAADRELSAAIREAGNVVLCGHIEESESARGWSIKKFPPSEKLLGESGVWGWANAFNDDKDNGIREHPWGLGDVLPLAYAAHQAAGAGLDAANHPGPNRWLRYYGPPGVVPRISYHLALHPEGSPTNFFRHKTVFVGGASSIGYSGTAKDEYYNPIAFSEGHFPGVEIHAIIYRNLLRQDTLVQIGRGPFLALIFCVGLFGLPLTVLRPLPAILLGGLSAVLMFAVVHATLSSGQVWMPWLILLLQLAVALTLSITINSLRSYVEVQVLAHSLSVHLPATRAQEIIRRPERLQPGSEKREITMLFAGINDFSSLADRTLSDKLYRRLDHYYHEVISAIHECEGTVIRLAGDRVFAIWNAPDHQRDHQAKACRAALAIRRRLNQPVGKEFQFQASLGLHYGPAAVGNHGNAERMDYTAIGANVEIAACIQSLNQRLGADILVSEGVAAILDDDIICRPLGEFTLRQFDRRIELFEVVGEASAAGDWSWVETFGEAVSRFRRRDWDAADEKLEMVLRSRPDDGPARFYREAIRRNREAPTDEVGAGIVIT